MPEITIPKTVRFDFLLVLLGLSLLMIIFYFGIQTIGKIPSLILLIGGVSLFFIGITYMRHEYTLELTLKNLSSFKDRYELLTYLKSNDLISNLVYTEMLVSLKKEIVDKQ